MASVTRKLVRVLISDEIDALCVQTLKEAGIEVEKKVGMSPAELQAEIANYDGLIVRSATKVTRQVIEAAKQLKVIGRAGTGVDNIDVPAATEKGVLVLNTPGGNTISAVEHTCAMLACMTRQIHLADASMRAGRWDRKKFMGTELFGKTLAIIGLGRIGREVATRMQAFGMRTIGFDPIITADAAKEFNVELMQLEQIWPLADYVTVHVPLIPQTANLINKDSLAKCKRGVFIVNVARGGIVQEADLLEALESGQCGGAALDVFDKEPPSDERLVRHSRMLATPHLGASTKEAQTRVAVEIAQQFGALCKGEPLQGLVNPNCLKQ